MAENEERGRIIGAVWSEATIIKSQRPALRLAFDFWLTSRSYFLGAIVSFTALATRNFTTVLALIWMGSPVCGLRPMRALRLDFTKRPRPGITKRPFFLVSLIAVSARCSKNAAAVLLLVSIFSAMLRTSWVLVMPVAIFPPY